MIMKFIKSFKDKHDYEKSQKSRLDIDTDYVDIAKKNCTNAFAADVEKYGFTKIDISGHTDSRGGIDNNVLSNNRAKAARAYLLSLLPNLKVTINGYADAINVATNATVEGMSANRRAEFRVVG